MSSRYKFSRSKRNRKIFVINSPLFNLFEGNICKRNIFYINKIKKQNMSCMATMIFDLICACSSQCKPKLYETRFIKEIVASFYPFL